MANKIYRYKRMAYTKSNGTKVKSWHKPIFLIRKKGDLTCEGCYFSESNRCELMQRPPLQLPSCVSLNNKQQFIFVRARINS